MSSLKYSRQREAVRNLLANRTDHPTADTVYSCLRTEFPHISLGTVYRNLSLLADLGEITRISAGNGAEHFDGNISPHQHFICSRCGRIYDMHMEHVDTLIRAVEEAAPGTIDSFQMNFFGVCSDCSGVPESMREHLR